MCCHEEKKTNPDLENLKDSFAKVKEEQNPIKRECKLLQEANQFDMPLDSYRKLFELYAKDKIDEDILDNFPRVDYKNKEDFLNRSWKWVTQYKWMILKKSLFFFIEKGVLISTGLAVIHYLQTIPQRQKQADEQKKQSHYQAWLSINSAQGKFMGGGRKEALEALNNDKISLEGVNVNKAFLRHIKLNNSNLQHANFREATLTDSEFKSAYLFCANFQYASLSGVQFDQADLKSANLEGVRMEPYTFIDKKHHKTTINLSSFKDANLEEASLKGVDLKKVIFSNANLKKTNFRGAKHLTLEQVQSAKNWKYAYYDRELRQKIGLPRETLENKQIKKNSLCKLGKQ